MRVMAVWMFLVAAMAAVGPSAQADRLSLRADYWCPYNCQPTGDRQGYIIDIARAVFAPRGDEIDYDIIPWSRALLEVEQGKITAAIGAVPNEAPALRFHREPIGLSGNSFAIRRDFTFSYTGIDSLRGLRFGAMQDYSYDNGGEIDQYVAQAHSSGDTLQLVSGHEGTSQNLRKLMGNRVDVIIDSHFVIQYAVSELELTDRVAVLPAFAPGPIYLAFNPTAPQTAAYIDALDNGIRSLRASGQLAAILARYGLRDWAE